MPVNIKSIVTALQKKATAVDSTTSSQDIVQLLKAIKKADGSTLAVYDSDGTLPDAAVSNQALGYIRSTGKLKINNGRWDEIGVGTGVPDANPPTAWLFQGRITGYTAGGEESGPNNLNIIEKFPLVSAITTTDVGDLTTTKEWPHGNKSKHDGFAGTGTNSETTIDKFSFASDANATVHATYSAPQLAGFGGFRQHGFSTAQNGYNQHYNPPSSTSVVYKFPFATENSISTTSITSTATGRSSFSESTSTTHGYAAGGYGPTYRTDIEKFQFSTDANYTDVGDLITGAQYSVGISSAEHGYSVYGSNPSNTNTVQRYSFASDGDAVSWATGGTLNEYAHAGISGEYEGFTAGGYTNSWKTGIHKFPYASENSLSEDFGDLSSGRRKAAGVQT